MYFMVCILGRARPGGDSPGKADVRALCLSPVPRRMGHLGNAFESESVLLFSGPGPCKQSAELSQLLTPSAGPIYLRASEAT